MKLTDHIYMVGSSQFGLSHEFDCVVYIVKCDNELVMIDTGAGCEVEKIVNNIKKDGLKPSSITRILLTHGHADHAGGAHELQERYGCKIYISTEEVHLIEKGDEKELGLEIAKSSGFYSPDYQFPHCKVSEGISHNQSISCGKISFNFIHVPGHSPGSICYLVDLPEGRALFSGDTVFAEGKILLLNIDGSSLENYRKNISRLEGLNIDMLFPGHNIFVLSGGQTHVDRAVQNLKLLHPPPNII